MAGTWAAFAAVLALTVFFVLKGRVPAGFAPLLALCASALFSAVFGMLGILNIGSLAWFVICAGLLAFALVHKKGYRRWRTLLNPALGFFVVASFFVVLYFGLRQPMLSEWDEFSQWGTSVKQMKVYGQMYTTAPAGWWWPVTQVPTLPLLSYLFQFIGPYAEWRTYTAYALLFIAAIAALFGHIQAKQYKVAVPVAIIGLLTPWFFTVYERPYLLNTKGWLSAYGDLPSGMLFGGVLAVYFGLRRQKARLWPVGILLAALALVKENTLVFALVAAGCMAVDLLFFAQKPTAEETPPKKLALRPYTGSYTMPGRLWRGGGFLLCAALPYVIWIRYIAVLVSRRVATGQTGETNISPMQAAVKGFAMLLGIEQPTEQFTIVRQTMWKNLINFQNKITMAGNAVVVIAIIAAIYLLAVLLAKDKHWRRRFAVLFVLLAAGFAGYYLMLTFSYGLIMKWEDGINTVSYNRYVYPYLVGWFLAGVACLGIAACKERVHGLASGGVLALALLMLLRTGMVLPLQNSAIGYSDYFYQDMRNEQKLADSVLKAIEDTDSRIFFVSTRDIGGEYWFHYHYRMMPAILDYGNGDGVGNLETAETDAAGNSVLTAEGKTVKRYMTPQELADYLTENNCDYLFAETISPWFVDTYAELFADGLSQAQNGKTVLYQVQQASGGVVLQPVQMEVPAV